MNVILILLKNIIFQIEIILIMEIIIIEIMEHYLRTNVQLIYKTMQTVKVHKSLLTPFLQLKNL